jgi:hypothetical protein
MFNVTTQKPNDKIPSSGLGTQYNVQTAIAPLQNVFGLYRKVNARGTLTLGVQPSNAETFTIGGKVYTFQTTLTNADGNIKIGATLAETQANVNAAINLTGTPGVQYALATRVNTQVEIGTFGLITANMAIIKAKIAGTAGNSIATTETMASGSNVFDAVTLGTYVAGADYSFPDYSFRALSIILGAATSGGTGQAIATNIIDTHFSSYGQYQAPFFNFKWLANAFKKIHIPNQFDNKIKSIPVIGWGLAAQIAQDLSTTTGHTSNSIQNIIEVGTNKGVAHYVNGTDSRMYVVAFTVDSTTGALTVGTPVIVSTSASLGEDDNAICAIGTDKFLVAFDDSTVTNFPKCAVGTISGTTITMAGGVQPVATATTEVKLIQLATDKALLVFNATSLYVVSIAVTTPSFGLLSTLTGATGITACQNGTDKFQLAYTESSNNKVMACTVSGTTITQGTALRISVGNLTAGAWRNHSLVQLTTDKILYVLGGGESYRTANENAYFLTVSGTVTTLTDSIYKGRNENTSINLTLIEANRVMYVSGYQNVGYLGVDLTNNLIVPESAQVGESNHFMRTDNNIGSAYAFMGTGNVRYGKIGSWIIGMCKQPDFNNKLGYWSFPINQNVEVYEDDEYVKTVAFKYPLSYFPVPLNLEINDYEANIKFKNPKNQTMYLIPYRSGEQNCVLYD